MMEPCTKFDTICNLITMLTKYTLHVLSYIVFHQIATVDSLVYLPSPVSGHSDYLLDHVLLYFSPSPSNFQFEGNATQAIMVKRMYLSVYIYLCVNTCQSVLVVIKM